MELRVCSSPHHANTAMEGTVNESVLVGFPKHIIFTTICVVCCCCFLFVAVPFCLESSKSLILGVTARLAIVQHGNNGSK